MADLLGPEGEEAEHDHDQADSTSKDPVVPGGTDRLVGRKIEQDLTSIPGDGVVEPDVGIT